MGVRECGPGHTDPVGPGGGRGCRAPQPLPPVQRLPHVQLRSILGCQIRPGYNFAVFFSLRQDIPT